MEDTKPGTKPQPKLKAFKTIRKEFAMAGISPKLTTQSYPLNWKISIGFLLLGTGVIFVFEYISNTAETFSQYTQSIYFESAMIIYICILLILVLKVDKLFEFMNCSENELNITLKYTATNSICYKANRFEEKLSKIVIHFITKVTPMCVFVPWVIYIYFIYFTTDSGVDAFVLPCPMWFPFDWQNPFGFSIAITAQYGMFFYGLTIGGCVFVLAIGSYLYITALSKVIKENIFSVNQNAQLKTDQDILMKKITDFLELYSCAKQLISIFSNLYQHFITMLFIWNLVTVCGAMLMIQIQLTRNSENFMVLCITMTEVFYAFSSLFVACELGQRFNLAFVECSKMVDQFDWYLFPTEIQRMLPLIVNFTQQPFELICFGSKACNRDTFKSVMKTAYSYFSVLRTFYK